MKATKYKIIFGLSLLTEAVQVVALFSKELATSCESLPDFLTIADLDNADTIEPKHLLKTLQYRVKL